MAFLTCCLYSHTLYSNITINVCLPSPTSGDQVNFDTLKRDYGYERGLPVVYLLHGMYGDGNSWTRFSSVDRYAQDRKIAVVTCSAGNNFYQDMPGGQQWASFFTKELPAYVCSLFPVSPRREDTFIAGFSMGGYGAWHLALTAPERYAKAASMSGAVDIEAIYKTFKDTSISNPFNWKAMFGDPEAIAGTQSDLFAQYQACAAKGCVPKLYQACGTEDFLYQLNLSARDRMLALGADLTYAEGLGGHDWTFWDAHIQKVLDWLLQDRQKADSAVMMG